MKRSIPSICAALACLSSNTVTAFAPSSVAHINQRTTVASSSRQSTSSLNLFLPDVVDHHTLLSSASNFIATIDSDIANIPDDEFGKVFAGGGVIIFGSILSTIFVGFLVEKGGGYADLVAETYAEQDIYATEKDEESFLESLGLKTDEQKKEAIDMVQAFREKKKKRAGQWTEEDEAKKKQQAVAVAEAAAEEKDMFSDYD